MRFGMFFIGIVSLLFSAACKPAAAPVAVGDRPVAVNGMPVKDAPRRAMKPEAELSWSTFEGNVQKVKDFKGRVLLLDFWATYCPPCKEGIPHLLELQARYPNDLQVIGLHVGGPEDRPKVPAFLDEMKITYPLAVPEDELTRFVFGEESAIPQTAIFDREGKFVRKIVGFDKEIAAQLDEAIAQAIAK